MNIGTPLAMSLTMEKATGNLTFHNHSNDSTIVIVPTDETYRAWLTVYHVIRPLGQSERPDALKNFKGSTTDETLQKVFGIIYNENTGTDENAESAPIDPKVILNETLNKIINFFKEFEFEPNYRFMNTLSYKARETQKNALDYINNYFALVDNSYKSEISSKCNSKEFKEILKNLKTYANPTSHINQRFAVYYGSAGTGKTTLAMQESDNRCVVCNASMLPSDLMEDFVFNGGQPTFQKSALWNCMEQGLPIVLDEINLLPFDSLRFLQGILDGKHEFNYKGHKVTIADGFKVIGTMNLSIGGMVYGLPEPLVDRCADMQKFSLSAEQLMSAII